MKLPNFDGNFRSSICCEVPGAGTAELLAVAAYPAYLVSWLTLQVPCLLLHSCETCHLISEDDMFFHKMETKPKGSRYGCFQK